MTKRAWVLVVAISALGFVACSGSSTGAATDAGAGGDAGDGGEVQTDCTAHEQCAAGRYCSDGGTCEDLAPGTCRKQADCPAGWSCEANLCVNPNPADECEKAPNLAKKAELLAAQPTLGVGSGTGHKATISATVQFASVADDPTKSCEVTLSFKDSSGDGALQPYEDWRNAPEARATDLLARMSSTQKLALMAHAVTSDAPTSGNLSPSAATNAMVDAGIRFGQSTAVTAQLTARAGWANALQERCEASALGIPFVLSANPSHGAGPGRVKARGFSQWPAELGLGATGDLAVAKSFGQTVSAEYRAIGIRMAMGVAADLATDPRWQGAQFSFGESAATVADMVDAYVSGVQGDELGATGVAAVVGQFPGAGAAKGGFDARFAKGKFLSYSGTHFDEHVKPFEKAIARGAAAVMASYGVPEAGAWSGLSGAVNGASIEQVGASFNAAILTDVLRGHFSFGGLIVAPAGALEDAGVAPFGAPWGVESLTRAQRIAKAVAAGVDQFVGLNDLTALTAASLDSSTVDAAALRALTLMFRLGLFENPYVDGSKAPAICNSDAAYRAGLDAMNRSLVLIHNKAKPAGWLNGAGNGSQTGDKGNAGNGSLKVLPAPPGQPYVSSGCDYFVAGDFDLDYVRSVSAGYGTMTDDVSSVKGMPTSTAAERMALSDYVFIRIRSPFAADPDTGSFAYPTQSLTWAGTDADVLAPVRAARQAIDASASSQTQIIVFVDAGRPSVVRELLDLGVSGIYIDWIGQNSANSHADKVALDVAFGIASGTGTLPVGLPDSDASAATQRPDVAGDGQDATFVKGYGFQTRSF